MKHVFYIIITSILTVPFTASAQVSFNAGGVNGGSIVIGASSDACTSTIDGAVRYNNSTKKLQLCNGTTWDDINQGCDTVPDGFDFTDVVGVGLGSTQLTSIEEITGVSCGIGVSISGTGSPEYRRCADATCSTVLDTWTSSNGSISSGEYLQVRVTASSSSFETRTATINVGTAVDNYNVTTTNAGTFKRVFLYQGSRPGGAYGGVGGADALCQAEADTEGLGGTYYAWLATDSTDDPESRFTRATVPYRNMDGEMLANDWTDLVDGGNLLNIINVLADGSGPFSDNIWTNINIDGTATSDTANCNSWTSNGTGLSAGQGDYRWSNSTWTAEGVEACDNANSLYCFEQ
jgi:hypothetical protein